MQKKRLLIFAYECLLAIMLLGVVLTIGPNMGKVNANSTRYADFVNFYRMGQIVLSKDRNDIYNPSVQLRYFNNLKAAQHSEQSIFAQYPPPFFLLIAPFALLPIAVSFKLWIFLSVISAVTALVFFMHSLGNVTLRHIALVILAMCNSFPGILGLADGQTSWFMLAVLTLFFWSFFKQKNFLLGLFFTLSLCKLQYSPFLIIPLLAKRKFTALAWAVATSAVIFAISAIILGWPNVIEYIRILFGAESSSNTGVFSNYMISMRGLVSFLTNGKTALIVSLFLMAVSLLPLYFAWLKVQLSSPKAYWLSGVTIISALIFSLHVHIYDDVLIALAAATFLIAWNLNAKLFANSVNWRLLLGLLMLFPIVSWPLYIGTIHFDVIKRIPFLVYNIVMLILAVGISKNVDSAETKSN